jgi:uncharacterized protein (DUF433 family)
LATRTESTFFSTGIFTVADAAALVKASERQVRGWVTGYPGRVGPLIENELGWIENRLAFSFRNLMELRFAATFVKAGVKLNRIRKIMVEVRKSLRHPHPFATNIVFKTDGKKIVGEIARQNGVTVAYDLETRNYELHPVILASLADDVEYDPKGDAVAWRPRSDLTPNVIVDPRISFGRPSMRLSGIPTRTLAKAAKAEKSVGAVAAWYEIPVSQVREAVKFESQLRRAA